MAGDGGRGPVREDVSVHARGGKAGGGAELSSRRVGGGEGETGERGGVWETPAGGRGLAIQGVGPREWVGRGQVGKGRGLGEGGVVSEERGLAEPRDGEEAGL